MWHDFFITGCVCFAGGAYCLLGLKFGWQEITDEATDKPIPYEAASVNCFAFGFLCFFLALLTAYVPGVPTVVGAVGTVGNYVNSLLSQLVFGAFVLYVLVLCLGGTAYWCYQQVCDAWTDGKGPALLAAVFLLATLFTLVVFSFPQPIQRLSYSLSFQTLLRGTVRLWSGLWHPASG